MDGRSSCYDEFRIGGCIADRCSYYVLFWAGVNRVCGAPAQFPAENRYTLFLELRGSNAIPGGKPLRTFPGIAWFQRNSGRKTATHFSWNCVVPTQFRTENRYTLFLELRGSNAIPGGKPLHTFPGIA
ncbi:hypothetical protein FKV68_12915 [Sinorhizobium mexicanum]|uniref:Uncharacterized protein n=1 Tax=Sinorhizobium mexicanum TaxID=375549 RepID=A0A859QHS6_9HYPH|nr:hypothetical protein FKV68_12915 [Sinorhizobium mexicanum]